MSVTPSTLADLRKVATIDLESECELQGFAPGGQRVEEAVDGLMTELATRIEGGDIGNCVTFLQGLRTPRRQFAGASVAAELLKKTITSATAVDVVSSCAASAEQSALAHLRRVVTIDLESERALLDARPGGWSSGDRSVDAIVDGLLDELAKRAGLGEMDVCIACVRGLRTPRGEFAETSVAAELLEGTITAADAVDAARSPDAAATDERSTMAAHFYSLLRAAPCDVKQRQMLARGLERECYNYAIGQCVRSENSYEPAWTSSMFVSVYAARCGLVLRNIEVGGLVAQSTSAESGLTDAVVRLARGEWKAADLGKRLTAAEICPQAGQKERDHIERRRGQKVVLKLSSMFTCPHCKARKHTQREVQIRGSDEASTTFCVCHECFGSFTVG